MVTLNVTITSVPAQTGLGVTETPLIDCAEDCKLIPATEKNAMIHKESFLVKNDLLKNETSLLSSEKKDAALFLLSICCSFLLNLLLAIKKR